MKDVEVTPEQHERWLNRLYRDNPARLGPTYVHVWPENHPACRCVCIIPEDHPAHLIQGHFKLKITATQTEGGKK